jgi:tetratricopeptide (TPR) repeat protein
MTQGQFPEAVAAFSRALDASGDDPDYVLARGVAETLAEQFYPAMKDLERYQRLGGKGREAELWTYVAEAMSGIATPGHAIPGPRSLQGRESESADSQQGQAYSFVSIPGHMIQGRDDYPTAYASFVYYEMAGSYGKARQGGGDKKTGTVRENMIKAGRWFAKRFLKRPDLVPVHFARAKQLHEARQFDAALREIHFARAAYPADPDVLYISADSWLSLGRPATARREFTMSLTARTDFAAAYLGRAMAAARWGDARRVRADLEIAAKLDAAATKKARSSIEAELKKQQAEGSPEHFLTAVEQAVQSGTPSDQIIDLAVKVHKATGERRLRYDETYQDKLRILEDAVRAHPKNPDDLVNLAEYIISESDNRGESVEPRRELLTYRWQESKEKERLRAVEILDRALTLNPKHIKAMIQKAIALSTLKQYGQAEQLADEALKLSGKNYDALRLYAKFRSMRANQYSAEAMSLRQTECTSSTSTETRHDGIYEVTTTTCYPPSPADLERANQLDAAASGLRDRARAAMEAAVKAARGTVDKYLIQADLQLWSGDYDAAQQTLMDGVKLYPESLEAQDALVDFFAKTGQKVKAEEQQAIARQLIHTTAAPLLRLAWDQIAKTAWQGARARLAAARQIDPADARISAYSGMVLEGEGKTKEAIAAFRVALALEEARVRLDEPPINSEMPLTRDPLDFGLAIQSRFHLAHLLEQGGKQQEELDQYLASLRYEPRMLPGWESWQMFTAMLPDQKPEKGAEMIAPVNAATLIAEAHLRAGKLFASLGKQDKAIEQFSAAARLGPQRMANIPMVGNAQGDTNFGGLAGAPASEASFYLARALLAKGDAEGASNALYEIGRTIPEDLRDDLNQLNMAIARAHSQQQQEQQDPYAGMSQEQRSYADRQYQRDRERQQMAARQFASKAKVVPELVGVWEMSPDNKFLPWKKTLAIESNANFTIASHNEGSARRGKVDVQQAGSMAQGVPDNVNGQMMMFDESGSVSTMWYEFIDRDRMRITDLDGTLYEARRR